MGVETIDQRIPPYPYLSRGTRGLRVLGHPKVPRSITNLIRGYAVSLSKVSPLAKPLTIRVVPGMVVQGPGGKCGFGILWVTDGKAVMGIPGEKIPDITEHDWITSMLPETVAHEWAHYEQWRDGKELQERGVAVRMRTLLRLSGLDWHEDKE